MNEIELERIRSHIEFLKKRGFCVLDIKGLPAEPWEWSELVQRGIIDAVRACAQEYQGGPAQ